MKNCKELCMGNSKKSRKIVLKGSVITECGETIVLFDGHCICKSYGIIRFKNDGNCRAEIYKNHMDHPVATVVPGSCFVLVSNPLNRIVVKCCKKKRQVDEIESIIFKEWDNSCKEKCEVCECCCCSKWHEEMSKKVCCQCQKCNIVFDGYVWVELERLSQVPHEKNNMICD